MLPVPGLHLPKLGFKIHDNRLTKLQSLPRASSLQFGFKPPALRGRSFCENSCRLFQAKIERYPHTFSLVAPFSPRLTVSLTVAFACVELLEYQAERRSAMQTLQIGAKSPDVQLLQQQLNKVLLPPPRLVEDDVFGARTHDAVVRFQRHKGLRADGVVGPRTWAALGTNPTIGATGSSGFNPLGKTFFERLDAFLAAANQTYQVVIGKQATMREPADAQKWHIAHMFYYNSFASRKPLKSELDGGHYVIEWKHISDARLNWAYNIDWRRYLRDKIGREPVKTANGLAWTEGHEPDKAMSKKQAYSILDDAGIATSTADRPHGAMVAPGYEGCGEPCCCGGHPSRHTAGLACDLDKQALKSLETKLSHAKAGSLDNYLKAFGLKRPMDSEPWHVEPTSP